MTAASEQAWSEFCAALDSARAVLSRPEAPQDALSQAEGLRYLSRLTRAAFESIIEAGDPDFPMLFQLSNATLKIGGDNPDTIYWNARLSPDRRYRISGNRGGVPYLSFGTKANRFAIDGAMVSTGEIEDRAMAFDANGDFELVIGREPSPGNWLPMAEDSSLLLVRQTFLDKAVEAPATLRLEAIDAPRRPRPLEPQAMAETLRAAAAFVRVTAQAFADWATMFMARPNEVLPWDQSIFQKVGGDPNIHYLHGYWRLAPDEAWIIETEVPDCRFWNFVLQNWWMESADYRHIPEAWTNISKARLEPDGRLVIVVAGFDPGFGNWIDTTGHGEGTALLRWIGADRHPVPRCRIATRAELEAMRPATRIAVANAGL